MKRTADLSTPLRSGRDDKIAAELDSALPGKVRGTADPSASLGMTKESASALWMAVSAEDFSINSGASQSHDSSGEIYGSRFKKNSPRAEFD